MRLATRRLYGLLISDTSAFYSRHSECTRLVYYLLLWVLHLSQCGASHGGRLLYTFRRPHSRAHMRRMQPLRAAPTTPGISPSDASLIKRSRTRAPTPRNRSDLNIPSMCWPSRSAQPNQRSSTANLCEHAELASTYLPGCRRSAAAAVRTGARQLSPRFCALVPARCPQRRAGATPALRSFWVCSAQG